MPGPEATMRRSVLAALRQYGDACAVDNEACMPGTPDINYAMPGTEDRSIVPFEGWIELKQIPAWPRRDEDAVKVPHFTPQQRAWIERRWEHRHNAHVLLRIGRVARLHEWFLINGRMAKHLSRSITKGLLQAGTAPDRSITHLCSGPLSAKKLHWGLYLARNL